MAWVAEITGYDIVHSTSKTLTFALGRGIAFTDAPYAVGAMQKWQSATQKISFDSNGQVTSGSDKGELAIINMPETYLVGGPLDPLLEWAWQGQTASLYWVPAKLWANRQLVARGTLEQPVAAIAVGSDDSSTISFPIRDPRSTLSAPLQTSKFGGTNSGGAGVDGSADLKGVPQPIMYGTVSNIPGVLVNSSLLIYKIADVAVTILCVRDGSLPITVSTSRGSVASLQSNSPSPGHYDYFADTTGTYIRLGSTPIRRLTFDASEGANDAARTHGQIWSRIRTARCGTSGGSVNIGSADTDAPNPVGFWWPDAITQQQALDEVLASLSGFEVQDNSGVWQLAQLKAPSGTAAINLLRLTELSTLATTDRPIINLTRVRPNYAPNGAPPYRVNVQWGHNYTVMTASDFLGAADPRLIDKFSKDWRVETATNTTIWDPVANTGLFLNAPELTINTGYQPGSDTLTCPHAASEASRLLSLYSGLKAQYQVDYSPDPSDYLLPGAVVSLTFPGFNLSGGPKFTVMQVGLLVQGARAISTIVIGLQT